jgi:hypothetical protein
MEQIKRRPDARRLTLLTTANYIELRLREPRDPREPRERELAFLPRETNFPAALRCRDLDERLFRAIVQLRSEGLILDAGTASSSYELPDEGNERDHEQEMNQPSRHVEDDEAE